MCQYKKEADNIVIGTGHGTAEEVSAIIDYATSRGAKQIIANHPTYMIDASISQMKDWASKGTFIKIFACIQPNISFLTSGY